MFSGIIQEIGVIADIETTQFCFSGSAKFLINIKTGDSIAVNGVCLSVTKIINNIFYADLSNETLSRTTFITAKAGDKVNLEKSLRLSDALNGHLVTGHIDGIGVIKDKIVDGNSIVFTINCVIAIMKYITQKGSICINGISLTIGNVENNTFTVNIIPHTLVATNLHKFNTGDKVNLEVDIIARYLEKLIK